MKIRHTATFFAILAAALYAINVPLSKLLLAQVPAAMMAAFLYLGAGFGLLLIRMAANVTHRRDIQAPLTWKELAHTIAMVVLDIAAPILLMLGIQRTDSANVSLLNNFEIVATSLVALIFFQEVVSRRLWFAIILVTVASILLGYEGSGSLRFHAGSLLVLGACLCWGLENNCTRMLSGKSSTQITTIKGCFSGLGSLVIALCVGEPLPRPSLILLTMVLGFVGYGLSINFYILAQKELGAAKTSAYYSVAPFLGVGFSLLLLGEKPEPRFYAALGIMVVATVLMAKDTITLQHSHEHVHVHSHPHRHGELLHTHEHAHTHAHTHVHGEDESAHSHKHDDLSGHDHPHGKETAI